MGKVTLYVSQQGAGTPLLLIHGAAVDSGFFSPAVEYLSKRFSCVAYDRRGYGRSEAPQDNDYSSVAQCADAAAIIQTVGSPCYAIAHSAGCIIALELAARYPELVRGMLLYEPPGMSGLAQADKYLDMLDSISWLERAGKHGRAVLQFYSLLGSPDSRGQTSSQESRYADRNMRTFLGHEIPLFRSQPDFAAAAKVPAFVGLSEMNRESLSASFAEQIAEKLHCPLLPFPGAHNCPRDLPAAFTAMTMGAFALLEQDA